VKVAPVVFDRLRPLIGKVKTNKEVEGPLVATADRARFIACQNVQAAELKIRKV
jgi:hypothetical protein